MFSKKSKDVIKRDIPDELIKQRKGGGQTLSYISGNTAIDLLNEAFDYMWSWEVLKEWIQESLDKQTKYDNGPVPQPPVAHVLGKLTVYAENGTPIVKTGYGSKTIIGGASEQESVFKAAGTDALKKAASLIGIGLELYRDEWEQAFFYQNNNPEEEEIWTEELLEKYSKERDYIKAYLEENNADINSLITEFDSNLSSAEDLNPDNIIQFTDFLKEQLGE